jgi:excisionase family DNA binding protein
MSERRVTIDVPDALIEIIVNRVLERLEARERPETEPWMNVAEAAAYLACPVSRVYALVSKRAIPCRKDGRRVVFRRSELDRYLEQGGATR